MRLRNPRFLSLTLNDILIMIKSNFFWVMNLLSMGMGFALAFYIFVILTNASLERDFRLSRPYSLQENPVIECEDFFRDVLIVNNEFDDFTLEFINRHNLQRGDFDAAYSSFYWSGMDKLRLYCSGRNFKVRRLFCEYKANIRNLTKKLNEEHSTISDFSIIRESYLSPAKVD